MKSLRTHQLFQKCPFIFGLCSVLTGGALLVTPALHANHGVLVEGEEDFDGDGNVGLAEDTDGDQIFGTINAALTGGDRRITIVTSGRFAETIAIASGSNPANTNLTIEAAPGVEASLEAVLTGTDPRAAVFNSDTSSNASRQATTAVTVSTDGNFYVTLRNLVIRNWSTGIEVIGNAGVLIDNCRLENNLNRGIFVSGNAPVAITRTTVSATGFRGGGSPAPDSTEPAPGNGIVFLNDSSGVLSDCIVTGNFAAGIIKTQARRQLQVRDSTFFDNNPDSIGVRIPR